MNQTEIAPADLENVNLDDDTIIEHKSDCWGRCWEFLHNCPLVSRVEEINSSSAEGIEMDEDTFIEYKPQVSECWGHTWMCIKKYQIVADCAASISALIAGVAVLSCVCLSIAGLIYGASLGAGVTISEIFYSKTYFESENDVGSSPLGQYLYTPIFGFIALMGTCAICIAAVIVALVTKQNQESED